MTCPGCGKPGTPRLRFLKTYTDGSVHPRTVVSCNCQVHTVKGFDGRVFIASAFIWLVPLKRPTIEHEQPPRSSP